MDTNNGVMVVGGGVWVDLEEGIMWVNGNEKIQ